MQEVCLLVWPFLVELSRCQSGVTQTTFSGPPRQPRSNYNRTVSHFLANLVEPVLDVDTQLRQRMREDLGGLPAVPTQSESPVTVVSDGPSTSPPFCPTLHISETES